MQTRTDGVFPNSSHPSASRDYLGILLLALKQNLKCTLRTWPLSPQVDFEHCQNVLTEALWGLYSVAEWQSAKEGSQTAHATAHFFCCWGGGGHGHSKPESLLQSVKLVPDLYEMFTCTLTGAREETGGLCPRSDAIEVSCRLAPSGSAGEEGSCQGLAPTRLQMTLWPCFNLWVPSIT